MSDKELVDTIREVVEIFGTGDKSVIKGTHMDLMDWKFGYHKVTEAKNNIQTAAYAVGGFDMYPKIQTITVHLIQPRLDYVTTHTFNRSELEDLRFRIRLIIERAIERFDELNPNTDTCRYCGRRVDCPALADKLLPLAKSAQPSVDDFEVAVWQNANPALVTDPETISKMKRVAVVLDGWKKEVDARALELATEEGLEIPGYRVYFRSPTIKLESAVDTFEALKSRMSPEKFQEACSVSLPLLAKAYASETGITQKKARSELEHLLAKAGLIQSDEDRIKSPYLRASSN